jgi:hypothetical protein
MQNRNVGRGQKDAMRRRLGFGAVTIVVVGVVLGAMEWSRRRATTIPSAEPARSHAVDVLDFGRYADPAPFADLCARLRQRYIAMDERYRSLMHTQVQVSKELDENGEPTVADQTVDDVWFEDGREMRKAVAKRDLMADRATDSPAEQLSQAKESKDSPLLYPFSKDDAGGVYLYELDGSETIDETATVRIAYRPVEPRSDLLAGTVWVDPASGEPVRFAGRLVKPPMFVDRFEMTVDYGRAENGNVQIRRIITDGTGGFALIRKRYRIETEFRNYR